MLEISGLFVYPVKSLPGVRLQQAVVAKTGFQHDRRWMLVDENNLFISQREAPQMTQLLVAIETDGLKITHKINGASLVLPFGTPAADGAHRATSVTIWDDICGAEFVSKEADEWFSKMLGLNCRLVYMPDDTKRIVDQRYAPGDYITSFSDGYPLLIIGQASLDDLNTRLDIPLPMDRFRPNIVFTGGKPFEEDLMENVQIAGINFRGVKLCARCTITTINQEDASRGKEPLKTLASYRQKNNKILFGQNLIHQGGGIVKVGDSLQIVSYNQDERFMVRVPAEKIS